MFHFKSDKTSNVPCGFYAHGLHFYDSEADITEEAIVNPETSLAATYKIIPGGSRLMRSNFEEVEKNKRRNLAMSYKVQNCMCMCVHNSIKARSLSTLW